MALYKPIEMDNGIVLSYHRIASLNIITNVYNIIEVQSYLSNEKRMNEKEDIDAENIYLNAEYICVDYDQDMSINSAYEKLKTMDKFSGATDC